MLKKIEYLTATVDRDALVKALGAVARFIEKRNTIPILDCVLIVGSPSGLSFIGTDLDKTATVQIATDTATTGALAVPAHPFLKLVSNMPKGLVTLAQSEAERLDITAGKSRLSLVLRAPEDFPKQELGTKLADFVLEAGTLREIVEKCGFCMSTEETRFYLQGIFLQASEPEQRLGKKGPRYLVAAATDGHRLAEFRNYLPEGAEALAGDGGVIIPRQTCVELLHALKGRDDEVRVTVHGGTRSGIIFETPSIQIVSKIVDGTFPDIQRVIPRDGNLLAVSVGAFETALAGVRAISAVKGKAVKLDAASGSLKLSMVDPDLGTASEEIEAEWGGPSAIEIGFNSTYVADMLAQMSQGTIWLYITDAGSPVRIIDPNDSRVLFVLMPMRV